MRFLFVDRIIELSPGEHVRGIKHLSNDDVFLCADEQGRACFIPSLIGETLGQLAAWNVMLHHRFTLRPVAGVVASAQFHRHVYPGETLLLESFIERLDDQAVLYNSIAHVNTEPVFTLTGALGPLLPMGEFINPADVQQQFNEIHRPGDWQEMIAQSRSDHSTQPIQQPASLLSLTFDSIVESNPKQSICAIKRISRAAGYFSDHFPNKPVLPLTVLLECKINLAKEFIRQAGFAQRYHFSELRKVKMTTFVQPGDLLVTQAELKTQTDAMLVLSFQSTVNQKRVCVAEAIFITRD